MICRGCGTDLVKGDPAPLCRSCFTQAMESFEKLLLEVRDTRMSREAHKSSAQNTSTELFLTHMLSTIAECEGGKVAGVIRAGGQSSLEVKTDIPQELWCKRCKSLFERVQKLRERWLQKTLTVTAQLVKEGSSEKENVK